MAFAITGMRDGMDRKKGKLLWQLFVNILYISTFTFGGGFVIVSIMKQKFVDELH